ncbi:MAG: alpha/beta fold hydrolase [Thermoflexales bacterium]|nr:alpha/beta fold hydrolase [Thermoflexales bacterium]
MPKIQANGIALYYEQHGWDKDADVVVLSNGVLMSTASWAMQVPVLAKHYRVLVYDCRGMWQSEHPAGPYSMEQHADDLAALLDALHIERAHIAGISYGGEISLIFGYKYPQRTLSVITSSAVSQVDPLLRGVIESWTAAARAKDPELFFQITYPTNFSEAWIAANQAALDGARVRYRILDFDAVLELLLSFSRLNITSELKHITAPTLVIVGEQDILKPRKYAEIIAREVPKSEFVVVPNSGHAVCWEQAGVFNTLLLGFLAKNAAKN